MKLSLKINSERAFEHSGGLTVSDDCLLFTMGLFLDECSTPGPCEEHSREYSQKLNVRFRDLLLEDWRLRFRNEPFVKRYWRDITDRKSYRVDSSFIKHHLHKTILSQFQETLADAHLEFESWACSEIAFLLLSKKRLFVSWIGRLNVSYFGRDGRSFHNIPHRMNLPFHDVQNRPISITTRYVPDAQCSEPSMFTVDEIRPGDWILIGTEKFADNIRGKREALLRTKPIPSVQDICRQYPDGLPSVQEMGWGIVLELRKERFFESVDSTFQKMTPQP